MVYENKKGIAIFLKVCYTFFALQKGCDKNWKTKQYLYVMNVDTNQENG